jgi:hypothetical protein
MSVVTGVGFFVGATNKPTPNVDRSGVWKMDTMISQRIRLLQFLGTLPAYRPGLILEVWA